MSQFRFDASRPQRTRSQRNRPRPRFTGAYHAPTSQCSLFDILRNFQTDEETQSCFLNTESQIEETVDNGGITIPAGLEMPLADVIPKD